MLRSVCGGWEVGVHKDLEPLLKAWSSRSEEQASAVVHVGFSRSPSHTYEDCAKLFPGRVLLTAAAMHALPPGYDASSNPVAEVEGHSIHLATKGWGYDASHLNIPRLPRHKSDFSGWVSTYVAEHPEHVDALLSAEIFDDTSYQSNEHHLSRDLREQTGLYRYSSLIGADRDDPCALAQAAPPWLAEQEFSTMNMTVRLSNVFRQNEIYKVADLRKLRLSELCRFKNFGRTSQVDLLSILRSALAKGPLAGSPSDGGLPVQTDTTLLAAIERTLASLSPRVGDILRRRMGLNGRPETLAGVGDLYGLTRERIRQIEAKTLKRLISVELWDDLLAMKLKILLVGRRYPLPLLGIEAVDPWFEGIGEHAEAVRYLLSNVTDSRVSLVEVDGVEYFSFMSPLRWESIVKEAKLLLAASAERQCTEEYCKSIVGALLPGEAAEFALLLWKKASERCIFVTSDETRILRAHGRGAEKICTGVLEESLEPLHYSEIAAKASSFGGRALDVRRAHSAATQVGLLLGPGIFGIRKHLKLSATEMEALAQAAEEMILEDGQDRQWHCGQILELLSERSPESVPEGADKYHLDIALRERSNLRGLGRMVWAIPGVLSEASRLEVRETILTLLRTAGRPLKGEEIKQRLCAIRGVSSTFQIVADDPLLKIGSARWGINDRDVAVKRDMQPFLFDEIVRALEQRRKGIHISELDQSLKLSFEIPAEEVFGLSFLDSRLSVSQGQYLYLNEWGEPRRETVTDAVKAIMQEAAGQPLTVDMIVAHAENRIRRFVDKRCIYGALHSVGARLVRPATWQYDIEATENDSDEYLSIVEENS